MPQQRHFRLNPTRPGIAAKRRSPKDPVARNQQRDRVGSAGLTDGLGRGAQLFGQLPVGLRFAERDRDQGLQKIGLKTGNGWVQWHGELPQSPVKIGRDFGKGVLQDRVIRLGRGRTPAPMGDGPVLALHPEQADRCGQPGAR